MKLSVALCTYNGEKYIEQQLKSILNQSVSVDEIIVCDDGSTDNTVEIINGVLSSSSVSFKLESNDRSLGVAANFLKALKLSQGDYVFTCDQDDEWHPDKVKIFLDHANKSKKDLYFSDGNLVDGDGKDLDCTLWNAYSINFNEITKIPILYTLIRRPIVTGAAMMVSKKLIEDINNIPNKFLHDEWFAVTAAVKNSIEAINLPTFKYRQHSKNVIGAKKQSFIEKLKVWISNYKKLEQIHRANYDKSTSILKLVQHTEYEKLLEQCYSFWESLVNIYHVNRLRRAVIVSKHFFRGHYSQFYTGIRGFIRDLIYVLFICQ